MLISYIHIFSPLFGLLTNVITQLSGCRYARKWGLLQSVFTGFFWGFVIVLTIEGVYYLAIKPTSVEFVGQIAVSTMTYIALGYCYFHFINLGETARRIRIVRELWESEDGLSMDELLKRYNASEIINARLQRMMSKKQIVLRDGRYYIGKPIMLYISKAIVMMKLILLGRRGEFE